MAIVNKQIVKKYLILCEGKDTEQFIIAYLNSKALRVDKRFGQDIQVFDFGGIDDLTIYLSNLRNMDGFGDVKNILVIRDAETDANRAISRVKNVFAFVNLPVPDACYTWNASEMISTAFVLLPTCDSNPHEGALEDLCWEILADKDADDMRNDISIFVERMKDSYHKITSHEHKSRLHTYFSVDNNLVSRKIGEAAKAGAFDWNNEKLKPLREIIQQGFELSE